MEPLLIILDEIDKFIQKLYEPLERKFEEDEKTLREGLRSLSQSLNQIETQLEHIKAEQIHMLAESEEQTMSEMLYVDYLLEKDQKEYLDNLLGKCGTIKENGKVTYYLEEKQKEAIDALLNKEGVIYYNNSDFLYGSKYYTINSLGGVGGPIFWHNDYVDKKCMDIGNVFKTKEEAEFACERLKVLAKMREYALPNKWLRDGYYTLAYHNPTNEIKVINNTYYRFNDLVFENQEAAMNCIDSIGEEKIIKYYFGVK